MGTACSSGPKSPRVASLGKAPSTTVPAPAAQPPIDPATFMAKLLAYTHCMRSHGIADFPDPTPSPAPTGKAAASALRPALAATSTPTTSATRPPTVLARRSCPSEGLSHLPVPLKWRSTQSSQPVPVGTGFPSFPDPKRPGRVRAPQPRPRLTAVPIGRKNVPLDCPSQRPAAGRCHQYGAKRTRLAIKQGWPINVPGKSALYTSSRTTDLQVHPLGARIRATGSLSLTYQLS
jgi:hypothetical protein